MTDGFLWGGFNIRKFSKMFLGNLWMIIVIMIITYFGLDFVDKQTDTPYYTSVAVAAVYPLSSSYRYHTIETVSDLSSKTNDISSVFNSDLFQSGLHSHDPSLKDCTIDSLQIANTDLLVMHATSVNPESAFKGIRAALDYYSQFSGDMTRAPEIKIIFGPEAPYLLASSSKIHRYRLLLCVFSGLMMAGLLLFIYAARKTYKTEHRIRKHYKNVRFFSLPVIKSGLENKKGIISKKNRQEPIKKLALQIKQVMKKCNKNTLFLASYTDKEAGAAILSALAGELAEQNEKVILIETESYKYDGAPEFDASDDIGKNTLLNVLQQKCTVKDAMIYREELNVHCIQSGTDWIDEDISYSIDDVKRVLSICLEYADIVLVNGASCYSSRYAQIWNEAVDVSIALCLHDDGDFFKVDKMLSDLQEGDTYFAGCVLFGF